MASFKSLFKSACKLSFYKALNKKFPLNVYFSITNRCNLNCSYCYGEYSARKNYKEFETKEIFSILDELKNLGTVLLQFQGGEPLIRNDIKEIIEYSAKLDFNLDLITNGTLINKNIDALKLLNSVCISLDGMKEINDKNRGKDTFEKIIEGVKICRELKIPTRINSVITADTRIEDVDFLAEFCKKNKCILNFGTAFDFKPITELKTFDSLKYDKTAYNKILGRIIFHKQKKIPIQFTAKSYTAAKNWPFPLDKYSMKLNEIPRGYKYPKCYHGDFVCFIDGDGRLYPCCNFWNNYPNVNVRDEGFKKGWEKLSRNNCESCYNFSYTDRNLLLNFDISAFINYFKNYIFDKKNNG